MSQAFDASGVRGEKSLIVMQGLTDMIVGLKREVTKIRAEKRKREEARLLYDHYRVKLDKLAQLQFSEDPKKKKKYERVSTLHDTLRMWRRIRKPRISIMKPMIVCTKN